MRYPRSVWYNYGMEDKTCPICGKPAQRTWCSSACHAIHRRKGTTYICVQCQKPFYVRPAYLRKGAGQYCSNGCRRAHEAARTTGYLKKGYKSIHRIVAAEKLGRPLLPGEVVHHIDGNKKNNDPTNLMVLPSHAAHMKIDPKGVSTMPLEKRIAGGKRSGEVRREKRAQRGSSSSNNEG
jgi:hypothetical protein